MSGRFSLSGDGDLASALRILNLFAQRGLAPQSVALKLGGGGYDLAIDPGDIDAAAVSIIREKIAAMPLAVRFREER
ncbi:hypothetical protein EAO27_04645 [Sphingopyxis sp. YF1]|uniref:hypothetical protein n=1 Tax=Sphingopyxis sp. YF1 TaxID=2482763 RepID=UPI001F60A7E9|nr:hypothetical protein [Sphingopyxis sp. YF1]UNU42081.1 hypothetical protein EAO27_04645 [Sphingopyxis sp. YF1]